MTFTGGDAKQRSDEHEHTVAQEFASIEAQLENLRALITLPNQSTMQLSKLKTVLSSGAFAKQLIADRRARYAEFPSELFADPAWDILLDLFVAYADGLCISVSSAVIAANVPPTTALRWIALMTDRGYLIRARDPHDGRRVHVALAEDTIIRVRSYLEGIATKWGIDLIKDASLDCATAN
jgi:hypothetical protein